MIERLMIPKQTGVSMMCLAAKHGGLKMVEYFINKGVWEVRGVFYLYIRPVSMNHIVLLQDGFLLLCAAVEGSQLVVVQYLAAMRVNLHTTDRVSGKNLLHVAVERASMDMIKYLVSKDVDTSGTTRNGKTLLHAAIERGEVGIVKYILSLRPNFEAILKVWLWISWRTA
jgi:ankyrin repeat protein